LSVEYFIVILVARLYNIDDLVGRSMILVICQGLELSSYGLIKVLS
jgi:hypothetical protein